MKLHLSTLKIQILAKSRDQLLLAVPHSFSKTFSDRFKLAALKLCNTILLEIRECTNISKGKLKTYLF